MINNNGVETQITDSTVCYVTNKKLLVKLKSWVKLCLLIIWYQNNTGGGS